MNNQLNREEKTMQSKKAKYEQPTFQKRLFIDGVVKMDVLAASGDGVDEDFIHIGDVLV